MSPTAFLAFSSIWSVFWFFCKLFRQFGPWKISGNIKLTLGNMILHIFGRRKTKDSNSGIFRYHLT